RYAGDLDDLAATLGVNREALECLEIGWEPPDETGGERWLCPLWDESGRITGLIRRFRSGAKLHVGGGRDGLVYARRQPLCGMILIPAGHSDVAAGLTLGLTVVGRSADLAGSDLLIRYLAPAVQHGAYVVVLGENDQKPSGLWPGRDGALITAQRLSAAWG